jgi:alkylation response protein AidB-like acyl-CoA dehydrogenase
MFRKSRLATGGPTPSRIMRMSVFSQEEPDEFRMMRETVRRFVDRELPLHRTREWERDRHVPMDVFRRLAALGVCGLTVDEDHGGLGRDIMSAIMVIEELSRAGVALAGPYIHCAFYGGINISEKGSAEQKAALLPKIANGELLFAYGLSEPDVGADLASVTTTARRTETGGIVVNGTKRWCTAADISDYIYCLVRSDDAAPRYRNLSFLLIPTGLDGITVEPIAHAGVGYAHSCDVTFRDVRVPAAAIVGGEAGWNAGWPMLAGPALDVEKLEVAAMAYGLASAVVAQAEAYAQEREQFGKPIFAHQAVAHAIAQAHTDLLACRQMLYHAAWLADRRAPCSKETSMAKLFVTETAVRIALSCQKVLGAYGFADEYDTARFVTDLLLMTVIGGSTNIQLNNIAKRIGR